MNQDPPLSPTEEPQDLSVHSKEKRKGEKKEKKEKENISQYFCSWSQLLGGD